MAREFRETPQTAGGGRMTVSNDNRIDLKMSIHTLEGAKDELAAFCSELGRVPNTVGRYEWDRAKEDLIGRINNAVRMIDGVMRRGAK